ncbi:MAG: transposase [Planctomycetota bacterium]
MPRFVGRTRISQIPVHTRPGKSSTTTDRGAKDDFRYRWRAGVEATMSRFKKQMGMARLRVRGMASVSYTATLRALRNDFRSGGQILGSAQGQERMFFHLSQNVAASSVRHPT